ncbi:MAG: hypothetical protein OQK98_12765 [Gammaproteobacteria bacterium]|nr:hypothetical protein [Gammaproteobacteria bacterium]
MWVLCEMSGEMSGDMPGIFMLKLISYQFTGDSDAALIRLSMDAADVLLFATTHGKIFQPLRWGHEYLVE